MSLEVPTTDDVGDVYAAAIGHGAPATEPRLYGGYYQSFIFDPDGYKIEVLARETFPETNGAAATVEVGAAHESNGEAQRWSEAIRRAVAAPFGKEEI